VRFPRSYRGDPPGAAEKVGLGFRLALALSDLSPGPHHPGFHQGACLSCTLLVCWYPTGRPQDGTLTIVCAVPARVFGSHV
jgi:hypothetical protein